MSKESFMDIIEKNKKILRAEYQRGYIAGSEKTRQELIEEFLEDIKVECNNCLRSFGEEKCLDSKCDNLKIYEKWEERSK